MPHISIPSSMPCEILNFTPLNPLISKCEIKVCYVGEEKNRNGSVISKATATEMARSLPGCPIVGFFNEATGDFEEHNRIIDVSNGRFEIKDTTRPYGFVSMDAKVWFQKFLDDDVEHEYLCTEGYIWSKVYPEAQRIIDQGNNQSMELLDESVRGHWSMDDKGLPDFFIINDALISKLCVLGENVEPCFEGAQIASHFSLSLDEEFKQKVFSMMDELKAVLDKGGISSMNEQEKEVILEPEVIENSDVETEFKKQEEEKDSGKCPAKKEEDKTEQEDTSNSEEEKSDSKEDSEDDEDKEKKKPFEKNKCGKKKKYSLEEIPEYVELQSQFAELQKNFDALQQEVTSLREFKAVVDRKEKQEMIDGFYMLSEEDKKDCIDNIDTYSLNDIEAKLSIICVRNKVNFNLDSDNKQDSHDPAPTVYTLENQEDGDAAPAWIKAVRNTAKNM